MVKNTCTGMTWRTTWRLWAACAFAWALLSADVRAETDAGTTGTTITLPSGVAYVDEVIGTGEEATTDSMVQLHYVGSLSCGTVFERSRERILPQPITFRVGGGEVVAGISEGVRGMRVGGRRRIVVPPEHGYGSVGRRPHIPPNATLIFDVELVNIKKGQPPAPPAAL